MSYNATTKHAKKRKSASMEIISPAFNDMVMDYKVKGYDKVLQSINKNIFKQSPLIAENEEIHKMAGRDSGKMFQKSMEYFLNLSDKLKGKRRQILKDPAQITLVKQSSKTPVVDLRKTVETQELYNKELRDFLKKESAESTKNINRRASAINYTGLVTKLTKKASKKLLVNLVTNKENINKLEGIQKRKSKIGLLSNLIGDHVSAFELLDNLSKDEATRELYNLTGKKDLENFEVFMERYSVLFKKGDKEQMKELTIK